MTAIGTRAEASAAQPRHPTDADAAMTRRVDILRRRIPIARLWSALTIGAASLSLVLLVAFWNNMLILGVAIDIALMAVAAIRPGWVEHIVA